MAKSRPMNQFCCQKGRSDSDGDLDSLRTTRVGPTEEEEDADGEAEEEGFLRVRPDDPEEATVSEPSKRTISRLKLGFPIWDWESGIWGF